MCISLTAFLPLELFWVYNLSLPNKIRRASEQSYYQTSLPNHVIKNGLFTPHSIKDLVSSSFRLFILIPTIYLHSESLCSSGLFIGFLAFSPKNSRDGNNNNFPFLGIKNFIASYSTGHIYRVEKSELSQFPA